MAISQISNRRRITGGIFWGVFSAVALALAPKELMPIFGLIALLGLVVVYWPWIIDANRWVRGEAGTNGRYIIVMLIITSFFAGLGYAAWQIHQWYSGDELRYSLCGEPIINQGSLIGLRLGIQWSNPGHRRVTAFSEKLTFDFGGTMEIPPVRSEFLIKTNTELADEFKQTNQLSAPFSEIILGITDRKPVPALVIGNLRYEWKFGRDRDNPKQRLVIAGVASMKFTDGGKEHSPLLFAPSGDSPNFIAAQCDLRDQLRKSSK